MRSLRLALVGLGLAGLAAGLVCLLIAVSSDHLDEVQVGGAVFTPLIGWSFIATGLFAWWRRPANSFGALMTLVGFVWFLSALLASDVRGLFAIGGLFSALPYALLLHMLVAFPSGRLQTGWERGLIAVAYFDTTVMQVLGVLFLVTGTGDECSGCPDKSALDQRQPGPRRRALRGAVVDRGGGGDGDRDPAGAPLAPRVERLPQRADAGARDRSGNRFAADHQPDGEPHRDPRRNGRGRRRRSQRDGDGLGPIRVPGRTAELPAVARRGGQRDGRAARRGGPSPGPARRARRGAWRPVALARLLGSRAGSLRRLRRSRRRVARPCRRHGLHGGLPRGTARCDDLPRRLARHRARAGRHRGCCRQPGARERAPERRAARAGRGAARLTGADRPGRRRRTPAPGARSPRRRPAAAGLAGARPAAGERKARLRSRRGQESSWRRWRASSARRQPSCASWRAACIRRS